ncbi:hypothetical protein P7K49_002325 [Saguinus oedipus]|uniref:Uncharacterized protein n=1 Tax=Saguinus oedipus TaxID=9490 RepID=A0ABQ9WJ33_SAGOE|nr:hypothetical protein P7K49_002325 [Saguinus oedipus]
MGTSPDQCYAGGWGHASRGPPCVTLCPLLPQPARTPTSLGGDSCPSSIELHAAYMGPLEGRRVRTHPTPHPGLISVWSQQSRWQNLGFWRRVAPIPRGPIEDVQSCVPILLHTDGTPGPWEDSKGHQLLLKALEGRTGQTHGRWRTHREAEMTCQSKTLLPSRKTVS